MISVYGEECEKYLCLAFMNNDEAINFTIVISAWVDDKLVGCVRTSSNL